MDSENLDVGNLSRHTLLLGDIKEPKVKGLARRLNSVSPHAVVKGLIYSFPPKDEELRNLVQGYGVIIECTGSDDVLGHLERFEWNDEKLFLSLSLGLNARRLYCFASSGSCFPKQIFTSQIQPWLQKDLDENEGRPLPREGIGCWHPVFPARADDVWLFSAAAAKVIDEFIALRPPEPVLIVFEQEAHGSVFSGLRRIAAGAAYG